MKYQVKLEQYQGPFDLLLQLIEQRQLDITEISLAKITKQYIEYLEKIEELYPEELADFLIVATKLLLIKSRSLLPYLQVEEEGETTNLEEQLKIYREFHQAAQTIAAMIKQRRFIYTRFYQALLEPVFSPPADISVTKLRNYFADVLASLQPVIKLPTSAIARAVSLKEKIVALENILNKRKQLSFKKVIAGTKNKTDIILTFLALLELVKQQTIIVKQDNNFADIIIKKI